MLRRWIAGLAVTAGLGVVAFVGGFAHADADNEQPQTDAIPVYLVHGGLPNDCNKTFGAMSKALKTTGKASEVLMVQEYLTDTNCPVDIRPPGEIGIDAPLKSLGRGLAQHIYQNYTARGQTVALIAHSMGGLIIRSALSGVVNQEPGFPEKLLVRDAVTLSSPHKGAQSLEWCGWVSAQCRDLSPGSELLTGNPGNGLKAAAPPLAENPQGEGGTDWTLIGIDGDDGNTPGTAFAMDAAHKYRYAGGQGIGHGELTWLNKGRYALTAIATNGVEATTQDGPPPVQLAVRAITTREV